MKILRFVWPVAAVVLCVVACGKGGGGGGEGSSDPADQVLLNIADEPAAMTDAELELAFPLEEQGRPAIFLAGTDPTGGAGLAGRLAAYKSSESSAAYFQTIAPANLDAGVKAQFEKGVMFGIDEIARLVATYDVKADIRARPFSLELHNTPDPVNGTRAMVSFCPDTDALSLEEILGETCTPRMHLYYAGATASVTDAGTFVHEASHVAWVYYQQSAAYLGRGGVRDAHGNYPGLSFQHEATAQFLQARTPDSGAYSLLIRTTCPFAPMQSGALTWRTLSAFGDAATNILPYQLAPMLDQASFHFFAGDTEWLTDWWVAKPDLRNPRRPEAAVRSFVRVLFPDGNGADFRGLNRLIVRGGLDLYLRGRNPWTTAMVRESCFAPGTALLTATAPGAAGVNLPLFSFNAARITVEAGALDALGSVELALASDRGAGVIGAVHAVDVPAYIACVKAIDTGSLGAANPRGSCNKSHVFSIGALEPGTSFKRKLKLDPSTREKLAGKDFVFVAFHIFRPGAPQTPTNVAFTAGPATAEDLLVTFVNNSGEDHVHFQVTTDTGTVQTEVSTTTQLTITGVFAGDTLSVNVKKPSDEGPVHAGSTTCKLTETPTNPTITYSGGVTCSGF